MFTVHYFNMNMIVIPMFNSHVKTFDKMEYFVWNK